MVGPVKVLAGRFFILWLLSSFVLGVSGAVKATGDAEDAATVDQTDMRGLGTA
jgi:hypothetical protein